jgi:hypothetical protein
MKSHAELNWIVDGTKLSKRLSIKKPNITSGKGRQVPCRNWTDSSLDPSLKMGLRRAARSSKKVLLFKN